jgi:hypothetical protein
MAPSLKAAALAAAAQPAELAVAGGQRPCLTWSNLTRAAEFQERSKSEGTRPLAVSAVILSEKRPAFCLKHNIHVAALQKPAS